MRFPFPLAFLIFAAAAFAQVDRATITGTLRDPSGSLIKGGKVVVTYGDTGLHRQADSNAAGAFLLTGLPIGHVTLDVFKDGFRPVRTRTDLGVGETKTLDFSLELSAVEASIQVVAETELVRDNAAVGATMENAQIRELPINGRNWQSLMTLMPGVVDAGNGTSPRFFGHVSDDNNFRIDGVDATSVRNQQETKSRLMVSEDSIAEFRVNSSLYTAESGGSNGGQVEIVTKSGTNQFHGSLFEYLRNSALDARGPFDSATLPLFHLNQFGAALGGPLIAGKTFFFASYEGLLQDQGRTLIASVPSPSFRSKAVPSVLPLVNLYPQGQTPTSNPDVWRWTGIGQSTQNEHSGLLRLDHRFSQNLSGYFRFSKDDTDIFTPNAALPYGTTNLDTPQSGVFDFLYLVSPRTTNELRLGADYAAPLDSIPTGAPASFSIPNLSTIPGGNKRLAVGISQSLIDQWSTLRGAHAIKAGVEIRRVQLIVHDFNLSDSTASYATLADFQNNRLNTVAGSGELPTKQMRKIEYFGYVQDEWKIKPNFTANLGLRYEFYNVFSEIHNREIPFDIQTCGGYCPPGSDFAFPDTNNLAPRVSFAWAPRALKDRTVIRAGGGFYFGDAQLGDQYNPANNDAVRYSLSSGTTPGLAYPFDPFIAASGGLAAAPRSMPRNKRNLVSQQWGLSIQQALTNRIAFDIGYQGQQNYHVFTRTYVNVIDPATGKRPLPNLDQVDVRGEDGVASFHGLVSTLQVNNWHGWLFRANYMFAHAINDIADGNGPQNVACRSCEKGNSATDARHVFTTNFTYDVPFARNRWYGGWQWSGLATAHTGLPLVVSVTRKAGDVPDGNVLATERPNLVLGVPLYLDYGSTGLWLNPAAFAAPARGTWGNLGRGVLRAPGLFQIDTAISKRTRFREELSMELGIEAFNILNHPQLGPPAGNISSSPSTPTGFGHITQPINSTPVGAGTPRQLQAFVRLSF